MHVPRPLHVPTNFRADLGCSKCLLLGVVLEIHEQQFVWFAVHRKAAEVAVAVAAVVGAVAVARTAAADSGAAVRPERSVFGTAELLSVDTAAAEAAEEEKAAAAAGPDAALAAAAAAVGRPIVILARTSIAVAVAVDVDVDVVAAVVAAVDAAVDAAVVAAVAAAVAAVDVDVATGAGAAAGLHAFHCSHSYIRILPEPYPKYSYLRLKLVALPLQ